MNMSSHDMYLPSVQESTKTLLILKIYFYSLSSCEIIILAALGLNPSLFAFLLCFPDCSFGLS